MSRSQNSSEPLYMTLTPRKRDKIIAQFYDAMRNCCFCPRNCGAARLEGEAGICGAGSEALISSAGPHFGEEKELVGRGGSGTIFFINCNLECLFCQNWTISRGIESGEKTTPAELAAMMLQLQERGCSNVNLVSPTPYLYQIAAAIDLAAKAGLHLPIVYNCGGYESIEALRLLDGLIDIYMPDAKYASNAAGEIFSGVPDYYDRLKEGLIEMQRQVGDLEVDDRGIAYRGLLVRHLVMPDNMAGSEEMARFISTEVSPNCAVNVMAQYYPAYRASDYPALNRRISGAEFARACAAFRQAGLRLL